MDAIISVICYKSKTLANGEHPLMLRIAQNGKSTYKSLKISVAAKHWDFDKNVPKPNNPHKDLIQKIILKTKLDYWKIQCKLPPKTKRFCPLVLK
jgi:hypothetical protein